LTYTTFYSEFAKALSGEGQVPVRPEEARDVIALIELARRSSQEGRTLHVQL
jgi:predicted dehydrogenase